MQRMKRLAAAAAVTALMVSPALAQDMVQPRAATHTGTSYDQGSANRHHMRHHVANRGYDNSYNRYDPAPGYREDANRDQGFWPADVAAGIVGGAIGTAGAIATAPFSGPYGGPYANNGFYHPGDFACQPGTYFRGQDGMQHICQ